MREEDEKHGKHNRRHRSMWRTRFTWQNSEFGFDEEHHEEKRESGVAVGAKDRLGYYQLLGMQYRIYMQLVLLTNDSSGPLFQRVCRT